MGCGKPFLWPMEMTRLSLLMASVYGNKGIGPVCGPSLYAMFRAVWFNLHVLFGTKMIAFFLGANGVLHVCKTSGTV